MRLLIDSNLMPAFARMSIKAGDSLAMNRGLDGSLNVDRTFKRDQYAFEYEFFDADDYNTLRTLYERQFSEGAFFRVQLIDSEMPLDFYGFILPQSIRPSFAGKTLRGYTLEIEQR